MTRLCNRRRPRHLNQARHRLRRHLHVVYVEKPLVVEGQLDLNLELVICDLVLELKGEKDKMTDDLEHEVTDVNEGFRDVRYRMARYV